MMTVVKTSNVKLWNDIIRKNGDLKTVRQTVKAFEIASEGSQMMKSPEEEKSQDKGDPEFKRVSLTICRHRSDRLAPSAGTRHMPTRIHTQLLEGDASSVDV